MLSVGAITRDDLKKLNPSLTERTLTSAEVIPADYALRVPRGQTKRFYGAIKRIPSSKRVAAGSKVSSKYHAVEKKT